MRKRAIGLIHNPYSFSLISKVFSVLVGFLFTVFQARFLGAEIKGQVATVNSIVSVACIVFDFGISQAYPYFKRNSQRDVLPIFMKLALGMLTASMVLVVSIITVFDLPLKYIAILCFTPMMVYDGIVSYVTLIEEPNKRSLTDMLVMGGELLFVVLLWLFAKPSFLLGLAIIFAKNIIKAVICTFWWRKRIFAKSDPVVQWLPKLLKFGFFPMLSLLMSTLNYRVDVIMLDGRVADALIGVYSIGVTVAERIWMIPDAIQGVMSSKLAKGKDAQETAFAIRLCNTGCLILIVGIIALGKPFIDLVFGPEYKGSYEITLLLLIGVFSMVYYKTIVSFNIVMGKQKVSFILLTTAVIANIVANYILIPTMGIYGAGIASVISYTVCGVLFAVYFCRVTKIPFTEMIVIKKDDIEKVIRRLKKGRKPE